MSKPQVKTEQGKGQVLASPAVIGENLMPAVVPNATPDPAVAEVNSMSGPAAVCAEQLYKADQSRLDAWRTLAAACQNWGEVKLARAALATECARLGMRRADAEASDWLVFALVYHADKEAAERYIAPDFRQPVVNTDGTQKKDPLGVPILAKPTTNELMATLRSERDKLAKQERIPAEVYSPRAPRKSSGKGENALTTAEYNRATELLAKSSGNNLSELFIVWLSQVRQIPDTETRTTMLMAAADLLQKELEK